MTRTRRATPATSRRRPSSPGPGLRLRLRAGAITSQARWTSATSIAVWAVGGVLVLDLLWTLAPGHDGSPEFALVDEPAHLATAVILIAGMIAVSRRLPSAEFLLAAAAASVLIDLDHVPGYLGWNVLTSGSPRPHTHGLLTVAVLVALGWSFRGRVAGRVAFGAAFGVAAHLTRDLVTGPGLAPLWPASNATARAPYVCYAAALVLIGAFAALRYRSEPSRPGRSPVGPSRPSAGWPIGTSAGRGSTN
jgi:inner membrane protein